jgi:hypothetical protein
VTAPHAILLVPTEAGAGLLARGRVLPSDYIPAQPPSVWRCGCGEWGHAGCAGRLPQPFALPVWWGGAMVPEGWDRASRFGLENTEDDGSDERDDLHRRWHPWPDVHACAYWLARQGLCRVILLDLVDGRLVERP